MIRQPKDFLFLILTLLFINAVTKGQGALKEADSLPFYKHQIELLHDNDFLLFTDWYYTTGSYITYRVLLNELDGNMDRRQLDIALSQEYYTPSNVLTSNIEALDRPYAGYSAITSRINFSNKIRLLKFTLQLGVSGAISGAEGFQSWFHSTNESNNPTWVAQIDDAVHANLYANYIREWHLLSGRFNVFAAWESGVAMGSKDIFIENGASFYFGKRNPLLTTMAYHQLGAIKRELFFAINFNYRYVMFDGLLEGNLVGDNSLFVIDPVDHFFYYGFEVFYRKKRMEFNIGYNYASPRAPETTLHSWIVISIARNF